MSLALFPRIKVPNQPLVVGISGTQIGATRLQRRALIGVFETLRIREFHHGDCVGVDEQAHTILLKLNPGWKHLRTSPIHVHPSIHNVKRAYCQHGHVLTPRANLERNMNIVVASQVMLIVPKEEYEILRSGTWASYRYARKHDKLIYLILPNGEIRCE